MNATGDKQALREELEQLTEKYGYFMGLAYEDENGNLATHPTGKVLDELVKFVDAYTEQRVTQELEYMRDNFVTPDKGGVESWVSVRLAQLKASTREGKK